jgi:hypothetical protein
MHTPTHERTIHARTHPHTHIVAHAALKLSQPRGRTHSRGHTHARARTRTPFRAHARTLARTPTHQTQKHGHTIMQASKHMHARTHTHTHAFMYPCARPYTRRCAFARKRARALKQEHTFTHACTHARTHARTHASADEPPHNKTYTHPPTCKPTLIQTPEAMPCFEECLGGRVGARTCACARMNAPQTSCSHAPKVDIRTHPNPVVRSPDQRLATRATRPSRDSPALKVAAGE